jgi:hypothetical protein
MVAERHRLGALQMRVARHHGIVERGGFLREGPLEAAERKVDLVDGVAHPKPKIGGHLVIAGAGGVQPAGRLADQRLQPCFHVHVDVLERAVEDETALGDL